MTDVFLDTGFVVALSDSRDRHHPDARERTEQTRKDAYSALNLLRDAKL